MNVTDLTTDQIAKIATNYVLMKSDDLQVLKITRSVTLYYGVDSRPVIETSVRVVNSFGKKKTTKVYIGVGAPQWGVEGEIYVSGDLSFEMKSVTELLAAELANPTFGTLEEEAAKLEEAKKEEAAKDAERKFTNSWNYIIREYNSLTKRHIQLGKFERVVKCYGVEQLTAFLPFLDGKVKTFVERCITLLNEKVEKETIIRNRREIKFSAEIESVLDMIEESIKPYEAQVYASYLTYFKANETETIRTFEQMAASAVEEQKGRMMYATVRDLSGLDITAVKNVHIHNHHNGFEGLWVLTLADGSTKRYATQTIIAGGYVQRDHYRYLTNLS